MNIKADFASIFKDCAIGMRGPIPICIILRRTSLLSEKYFLKNSDIKNVANIYIKTIVNAINFVRPLFDELSLLSILRLL